MELVGLAKRFSIHPHMANVCEADYLMGIDNTLKIIHGGILNSQGQLDVGEISATSTTPATIVMSRAPQATPLMYPYVFTSRQGKAMMTGTPVSSPPAHGHSFIWGRGGGNDNTWYQMNAINPILYEQSSGAWSQIYNNAMIDLPGGYWLCMPEIGGGLGSALGTALDNIEYGKSSGYLSVFEGAGNAFLDNYRDTHVVMWFGARQPARFGHATWYTTIATAEIADIINDHDDPANWTVHSERFMMGANNIHVCDPTAYDGPEGARVMVSYNQNAGMKELRSVHSLTDLYAELIQ